MESGKDVSRRIMRRSQIYQGNEDTHEPENMDNQDDDLNGRKRPTDEHVDYHAQNQSGPNEHCSMIAGSGERSGSVKLY